MALSGLTYRNTTLLCVHKSLGILFDIADFKELKYMHNNILCIDLLSHKKATFSTVE